MTHGNPTRIQQPHDEAPTVNQPQDTSRPTGSKATGGDLIDRVLEASETSGGQQQSQGQGDDLIAAIQPHLDRAVEALLARQYEDGYFCAELEGDSILQSEYILAMWVIGREDDPRLAKIANYLRSQQLPTGAWSQYPEGGVGGGVIDPSATVKAYFALKLMGDDPQAPHMVRAREQVLAHGGAERINTFSKYYLAALGQVSYSAVPIIPPQIVYLPRWFFFHLDKVSAWSRTMIQPLSIITTYQPVRPIPEHLGIGELFADEANRHRLMHNPLSKSRFWMRLFHGADRLLKAARRVGLLRIGRRRAVARMERWIIERCQASDGPGAIFPPIIYLLIAFRRCLGYEPNHPIIRDNLRHLDHYMIHGREGTPRNSADDPAAADGTIRLQPCESPTWDTGIAAYALTDAGLDASHPAMKRCADWLLSKECRHVGDWANNVAPGVKASGWFFEFNNPWYPDVDDTVMIAMALKRIGGRDAIAAGRRGIDWVLALQNDDGGWAAFDKTRHRPLLEYVPFADHNAIQDPSCPDITGRVLECLGWHGYRIDHPAVQRAVEYVKRRQEPEGCWFGRWGVNYIYGTWQSIGGMRRVGVDMSEPWVQRAGQWLRQVQKPDGSFGESPDTYEDPSLKGRGPSTASQTAWGAMALMTIHGPHDEAVQRAIRWLADTQLETGTWDEPQFTGTGFPRVFYLRYHLYRLYFPVMAMGRWLGEMTGRQNAG